MQPMVYDQLGTIQQRTGNRSVNNAPRNTYKTRDDKWVAISTSAQSIAERVMELVGHPEVIDEPWFASRRPSAPSTPTSSTPTSAAGSSSATAPR